MGDLSQIENVVFSGGGVRGVAFCGALMAMRGWLPRSTGTLPVMFPRLKRVSGTSVGGIFACATAMRMSSERLFQLLDNEAILEGLAPKVDLQKLHRHYGLDSTQGLREGIRRVLEVGLPPWGVTEDGRVDTITLGEIGEMTGVELCVCTTRIGDIAGGNSSPRSEMLSSSGTPDVTVIDALVMSMAVPVLYQPVIHTDGGIYVDGALLNNSPVADDMDPTTTLVLRIAPTPLNFHADGFQGYISTVMYTPMQWIERHKTRDYPNCIEVSSCGVKTFDFQAPRESIIAAILDGMVCTFRWLANTRAVF